MTPKSIENLRDKIAYKNSLIYKINTGILWGCVIVCFGMAIIRTTEYIVNEIQYTNQLQMEIEKLKKLEELKTDNW